MTKSVWLTAALMTAATISAQGLMSPPAQTSVTIAGKTLSIKYNAPSVKGRKMFGDGGRVNRDASYPVWRAGANDATAFHTEAALDIKGLHVPAGDYTIFVQVTPDPWQLIINKQTGQSGLIYKKAEDLGRITMDVTKPAAPIETLKITLSATGPKTGKLQIEFENYIASVPFTIQ